MPSPTDCILALDVGTQRIGVAKASYGAWLASVVTTLPNDDSFLGALQKIIDDQHAQKIIVGLPRGMDGQDTGQTHYTQEFAENLKSFGLPIAFQDESLTSHQAEQELTAKHGGFQKGQVDSLAAVYILEDYLDAHLQEKV